MKIALVINSIDSENWIHQLTEKLISHNNIQAIDIIVDQNYIPKQNSLLKAYLSLEKKIFKFSPDFIVKKRIAENNSIKLLNSSDVNSFELEKKRWDLILDLRQSSKIYKCIHLAEKYCLVNFSLREDESIKTSPYLIETFSNELCGIKLYEVDKLNCDKILISKLTFPTDSLSVLRNLNSGYAHAIKLIFRYVKTTLKEKNNTKIVNSEFVNFKLQKTSNKISFGLFIKHLKKYPSSIIKYFERKLYLNQWILMFKVDQKDNINIDINSFTKIIPPKDRFWADPFIVNKNGRNYIFIEELIYTEKKGFISVMEIDHNGRFSKPKPILKRPYHLSYPFIFEDNNTYYMIPETSENKTIELYECIDFPYVWEYKENIMDDVIAVDTTILKKDDKYWLFTNLKTGAGTSKHTELHLFYSENILSKKWNKHPQNPIVQDATKARSAGNIFPNQGGLIRPSQNCGKRYGESIVLNEIIELNETCYNEKIISQINPAPLKNIYATHSVNKSDSIIIIDAILKQAKYW